LRATTAHDDRAAVRLFCTTAILLPGRNRVDGLLRNRLLRSGAGLLRRRYCMHHR
jgi:hypothetical protein